MGTVGGFYGGPGWYPATDITRYDAATIESDLYDVKTMRLI